MENTKMDKYTAGFGLSVVVTSLLNAFILIIKEKSDAIMSALKAALGHHWTTHGVIVIIAFLVLGFVFSGMKFEEKIDARTMQRYIIGAVILSCVVIAGFFLPNLKLAGVMKY